MTFAIQVDKRVRKEIAELPKDLQERIVAELLELSQNPFRAGVIKLTDQESYRTRVGDYRIVFDVYPKTQEIVVLKVLHRREVYKRN
jgi:mRNA interferase RelE/StbE